MVIKLQSLLVTMLVIDVLASPVTQKYWKVNGPSAMLSVADLSQHDYYEHDEGHNSNENGGIEVYIDHDEYDDELNRNSEPSGFDVPVSHIIRNGYDVIEGPRGSKFHIGYIINGHNGELGNDNSNDVPILSIIQDGHDILVELDRSGIHLEFNNDGQDSKPGKDDNNSSQYDTAPYISHSDYVKFDWPDEFDAYDPINWASDEDEVIDTDNYILRSNDDGSDESDPI